MFGCKGLSFGHLYNRHHLIDIFMADKAKLTLKIILINHFCKRKLRWSHPLEYDIYQVFIKKTSGK